ncbi:T9SS type A sorting domain-containing protein [Aurantibacillus circumpalustris]|uniref:T9SS type A sorting domain-containing protein n=1 Tax=Aurantibacillus circumpalustris TaxID=3036359 RepID=UPI00295C384C|nr:T9SS type A sorting domain-containing protein [Aurantibacillus circumpalustris]
MKNYLFHLVFLILSINSFAQNEFSKWYFGRHTGLDFMTSPPSVINHTTLNTFEGSASAADAAGNLLFYTDGSIVWNKQQLVMANGTGLFGNGSTVQSSLIVKQPGNSTIYYVFTLAFQGTSDGLRYSLVDMSLAAGLGSVTAKNIPISTPCTEQLNGVRHCNGVDMWIVTHEFNNNNFRSFLLNSSGLNLTPVLSSIGPAPPTFTPNNSAYGQGTIKLSPNGKKLGLTFYNGSNNSEVALFDFDKSTGIVSNYLSLITSTVNHYGCEFSGDGTKFYTGTSNGTSSSVFQWDLCASSNTLIHASKTTVANPAFSHSQFQLAPNGKIYIVITNSQTLAAIENPNLLGIACNYTPMALSMSTGSNGAGLPNFFGGAFRSPPPYTYTFNTLSSCFTASFTVAPSPTIIAGCGAADDLIQSISWDFGQPQTGALNTSTLSNPTHDFGGSGSYPVKLIYHYQCGADTVYKNVIITGPFISVNSNSCTGSATLNISGGFGPYSYTWSPSAQTSSIVSLNAGTYTVTVNDNGPNCNYSIITQIAAYPSPTLNAQSISICLQTAGVLNVSGASNYTWFPGGVSGASYTVSPPVSQTYSVTGTFTNGCASNATVSVTVLKCTSINEENLNNSHLKIYPNPFETEFFIETEEELEIIIFDHIGCKILSQKLNKGKNAINVSSLNSGVYLFQTSGKNIRQINKLIKLN